MVKAIDLTGEKFQRLSVIKRVENTGYCKSRPNGKPTWKCECQCGVIINVMGDSLRSGHTKSCGCLNRELSIKRTLGMNGKKSFSWKGGRYKTGMGYIYIYTPEHPYSTKAGYILEHRSIIEKYLDRILSPFEVVHHRDGDKSNNDINNLMLFNNNTDHLNHHRFIKNNEYRA